jgi:hypothetical protein
MKKSRYFSAKTKTPMMQLGSWVLSGLKPYQGLACRQMIGRGIRGNKNIAPKGALLTGD